MNLAAYRQARGLTQVEAASELGLKSAGHLSDIERGERPAGLRLALRIERWSKGQVKAAEICPDALAIQALGRRKRVA